jgi:hypothetical protein
MRSREQMRSTLAEYPAVEEALDDLADEHGDLMVSTLDDFCDRHPDSEALRRAAVRISGSSTGWFLVTVRGARVWMVAGPKVRPPRSPGICHEGPRRRRRAAEGARPTRPLGGRRCARIAPGCPRIPHDLTSEGEQS